MATSSADWGCCAAPAPGRTTRLVALLEAHRAEPRRDLGRNEPCWCGSGRKYKKCHLGREQLPLAERADWLYAKAAQHARSPVGDDLLAEVGYERCRLRRDPSHDLPEALDAGMADPLVMDVVLFEGGAFAEFLQVRGSLLPDDERLLAEQWLLAGPVGVRSGEGAAPARASPCATCAPATRTKCASGRPAAS